MYLSDFPGGYIEVDSWTGRGVLMITKMFGDVDSFTVIHKAGTILQNWPPVENFKNMGNSFRNALNETCDNDDVKPFAKIFLREVRLGFLKHITQQLLHVGGSRKMPFAVCESSDTLLHPCVTNSNETQLFYRGAIGGHSIDRVLLAVLQYLEAFSRMVQTSSKYKELYMVDFCFYHSPAIIESELI